MANANDPTPGTGRDAGQGTGDGLDGEGGCPVRADDPGNVIEDGCDHAAARR